MMDKLSAFYKKKTALAVLLALAAAGFMVWGGTLANGFLYDDDTFVVENENIRSLTPAAKFFSPEVSSNNAQMNRDVWRPLTTASYALSYALHGLNPAGFHAFNVAGHVLNAYLFFLVALALFGPARAGGKVAAFAAALLFLLHPAQSETVAWVSQRSNILFLAFYLAAYLFYIKSFRYPPLRARVFYALSLALFALSLLSKEMAASLPVLVLLTAYIFEKTGFRRALIKSLPYAVITLLFVLARSAALGQVAQTGYWAGGFAPQLLTMVKGFAYYVKIALLPYPLSVEYLFPVKRALDLELAAYMVMLAGILAGAWRLRRGRPLLSLGIFFFFAALLPVSNIIPIRTIINERFLYIALAGLALAAADLLAGVLEHDYSRLKRLAGLGALLLAVYCGVAVNRSADWKDHWSFVNANLKTCPQSATLHYGLGRAYAAKGLYAEAAREFELCLSIDPMYAEALADLGRIAEKSGDTEAAITRYRESLQKRVDFFEGLHNLGLAYYKQGDFAAAVGALEKAVAVKTAQGPSSALLEAKTNLAAAYAYAGEPGRALALSEEVLRADPAMQKAANNLGLFRQMADRSAAPAQQPDSALALIARNFPAPEVRRALAGAAAARYVRDGREVRLLNTGARRPEFFFRERLAAGYRIKAEGTELSVSQPEAGAGALYIESGALVYRGAYRDTDVLYLPEPEGVQEMLLLRSAAAPREIVYEYSRQPRIAASGDLEVAGLSLSRPVIFDARGRRHGAAFAAAGPGRVKISVPAGLAYPALIDPSWRATANLPAENYDHTGVVLPSGKTSFIGGYPHASAVWVYDTLPETYSYPCAIAYNGYSRPAVQLKDGRILRLIGYGAAIYDPELKSCSVAGVSTLIPTTATLLPDGTVLVAGSPSVGGNPNVEIYDPYSNTFSTVATLGYAPQSAVLLQNGKVLFTPNSTSVVACYLYDIAARSVSATGSLATPRAYYAALPLNDGRVVLMGGYAAGDTVTGATEIYDPASGVWNTTGSMLTPRRFYFASLLPDGKIMAVGGEQVSGNTEQSSAEIYDPQTGTYSILPSYLTYQRTRLGGALTPYGSVLVAGGMRGSDYLNSSNLLVPTIGQWISADPMSSVRQNHSATMLPNGKVLVAGGREAGGAVYSTAQLYDPAAGTWSAANAMGAVRYDHTATLLANGNVLVTGGNNGSSSVSTAELYDYNSGAWSSVGSMSTGRYGHTATLLPDGRVLVAGGAYDASNINSSADIYDPVSGTWSTTGAMASARANFPAALLPDGRVLVSGGTQPTTYSFSTAEIYNPLAGTWSTTGSMSTPRGYHTMSVMTDGRVLAAGGEDAYVGSASAELFNPVTGAWTTTASMAQVRYGHAAVNMPDGRVLVTGGNASGSGLSSAEIYSTTGRWDSSGAMTTARLDHTATLLPNGNILLAGGNVSAGIGTLSTAELASYTEYDYRGALSDSARPYITSVGGNSSFPVKVATGTYVDVAGGRFNGISQGGSGHWQGGNYNSPTVFLKKLGGGGYGAMSSDGELLNISSSVYIHEWSSTTVRPLIPTGLPFGYYYLWAVSNGMPSDFKIVQIATDTFASVPPDVLSASAVSSDTYRVYFATQVAAEAEDRNNHSLAPYLQLSSVTRRDSYLAVNVKLASPFVNNSTYTATVSATIDSLYGGSTPRYLTGIFAGVNPAPYFFDDFNRPSGVLTTDTPIPGGWDISSVHSGNSVGISTMAYRGGYGMVSRDLSAAGTDAYAARTISPAAPAVYFRHYFYIPQSFMDAMGLDTVQYISRIVSSANSRHVAVAAEKTATGNLKILFETYGYGGAYNTEGTLGADTINPGSWHCIEMYAPPPAAGAAAKFWMDGRLMAQVTSDFSDAGDWQTAILGAGWSDYPAAAHELYFDEARVSTATYIGAIDLPSVLSVSAIDKTHLKVYFDRGVSPEDGRYLSSANYSDPYLTDYGGSSSDSFRSVLVQTAEQTNNLASTMTVNSALLTPGGSASSAYIQTNADLAFLDDMNRPDDGFIITDRVQGPWSGSALDSAVSLQSSAFSFRGAYSMYANDDSALNAYGNLFKDFSPGLANAYSRFYVYLSQAFFDAMANDTRRVLGKTISSANTRYINLLAYKDATGNPTLIFQGYDSLNAYPSVNSGIITTGEWHCIEMYAPPIAADTTAYFWLDGIESATINTNFSDAGTWTQFQMGLGWTDYPSAKQAAWFDEVAVSSDSRIGPIYPPPGAPAVKGVYLSSFTVTYSTVAMQGYTLEASTSSDFSGTLYSTSTYAPALSTLTVSGLLPNTEYFLRLGSLAPGTTSYEGPYFTSTATLANQVSGVGYAVSMTSITVNWLPHPATPSSASCSGYLVQVSSYAAFTAPVYSSMTTGAALSTLTVSGLYGSQNYYIRVAALNGRGVPNFSAALMQRTHGWETVWSYNTPINYTDAYSFGDFNNDGRLDLAEATYGAIIRLNNGGNDFGSSTWSVVSSGYIKPSILPGDYDNDGDLDLTLGYGTEHGLFRNNGGGTFTRMGILNDDAMFQFGDYNNDGLLDILTEDGVLYRNNGNGTYSYAFMDPVAPNEAAFIDCNGDGLLDIVTGDYYGYAYAFRNNGDGTFTQQWRSLGTRPHEYTIAVGDLDNDGDLDFIGGSYSSQPQLYRNYGDCVFNEGISVGQPDSEHIALADYDNDGYLDLAMGDGWSNDKLTVFRNNGDLTFNMVFEISDTDAPVAVWGDQDSDGRLDLAVSNYSTTIPERVMNLNAQFYNSRPEPPAGLDASFDYNASSSSVYLKWDSGAYDGGNSPNSLYYQVVAATQPMTISADGFRVTEPSTMTGANFILTWNYGTPMLGNYIRPPKRVWPGDYSEKHGVLLRGAPNTAGMLMNTTYYFRVQTIDAGLMRSSWSYEYPMPATLAMPLPDAAIAAVGSSSITLSWTSMPAAPPNATCEGYRVEASTASDFSGTLYASSNSEYNSSGLSISGLVPNTIYFLRAGTLNWNGVPNYALLGATSTLTLPAQGASIYAVNFTSITINWLPRPAAPQSETAEGYLLQASTSSDFTGLVHSSASYSVAPATLTIAGLLSAKTYFLRLGTLNWNLAPNFVTAGSTTTRLILSPPSAVTDLRAHFTPGTTQQILLTWTSPADIQVGEPYYDVRYSSCGPIVTDIHFSTAVALSGEPVPSVPGAAESFSLTGLMPGVTYYFAIKSANYNGFGQLDTNIVYDEPYAFAPSFWVRQELLGAGLGLASGRSALGDIDGDGDLDLLAVGHDGTNRRFVVYKNDGNGSFSLSQNPYGASSGYELSSVALADLDGDGDLDAVTTGTSDTIYVHLYKNAGDGVFGAPTFITQLTDGDVAPGDIDNDGDVDLLVNGYFGGSQYLRAYTNSGTGGFTLLQTLASGAFDRAALGDIDGDGDLDLAASGILYSEGVAYLRVYTNDGGTSPFNLLQEPLAAGGGLNYGDLKLADIDSDGDLDLLAAGKDNTGAQRIVFLANSGGASPFGVSQEFSVGLSSVSLAPGDLDNDGDLDILACGESASAMECRAYLNSGGATPFTPSEDILGAAGGFSDGSVVAGDLDGDGDLDAVINGVNSAGERTFINLSSEFARKRANTPPGAPVALSGLLSSGKLFFKWENGLDYESTDPDNLYYAIRIATNSMAGLGQHAQPAKALIPGAYATPLLGNYLRPRNTANSPPNMALLGSITMGTSYYWQVKTIDAGLKASAWSAENMFYTPKSIYPTAKDATDTTLETTISDIEANDTSGAGGSVVTASDGWYSVPKTLLMYVKDFDTSTIVGIPPFTNCFIEVQYNSVSGYFGTQPIQVSTASPWTNWLTITTPQTGLYNDVTASLDLMPYNIRTSTQVAALRVKFLNSPTTTPPSTNRTLAFDYVFVYALSADTTPPAAVTDFAAASDLYQGILNLSWSATGDDGSVGNIVNGGYRIEYSTDPLHIFDNSSPQVAISSNVTAGAAQKYKLSGLAHGSTYYVRLFLSDELPNWSGLSNGATVYLPPPPGDLTIFALNSTSFTVVFSTVGAPKYLLEASTASDFSGTVYSSATYVPALSTLTLTGLYPNTEYYIRAGALWAPTTVYAPVDDYPVYTLSNRVTGDRIYASFPSSTTVNWLPLPATPSSSSCAGYLLQASTAADFSGTLLSSYTYQNQLSTLTITGLEPCRLYHYRVASLNGDLVPNFDYTGSQDQGSQPPVWDSPADNAGYTINRRFKMWFTVNACTLSDARITISTSALYEVNISTTFVYSQSPAGWTGLPAPTGNKVYFTPQSDLSGLDRTFYLKAAGWDGDSWTADSSSIRARLRGDWAWSDEPITPLLTLVRAPQISELRGIIENLRLFRGLTPVSWTEPSLAGGSSRVRTVHFTEPRTYMEQLLSAVGEGWAWTDTSLAGAPVKAVHMQELRDYAEKP